MRVTDVQLQKVNRGRVNIFIDNTYRFSMDEVDAVVLGIKIGRELNEEDINECLFKSQYAKAKDKALDMLSRKNASRKMVFDYLKKKEYDEAVAQTVCDELEELGYIDDFRYAVFFTEYAAEKVWGERRVRYELAKNGVDANIIEDVICSSNQLTAEDLVEKIIDKYSAADLKDIKSRQKIQRYYASHGFDFGIINSAINICISRFDDESALD